MVRTEKAVRRVTSKWMSPGSSRGDSAELVNKPVHALGRAQAVASWEIRLGAIIE